MRTFLRGKISLLFMTCAVVLALPAIALADDISNNLDPTIDAQAEVMPLTVGGTNGTTDLYVTPRNGDNKNGCNLSSGSLQLSVSSSNPAVATVSPSSVAFTSCGDVKGLTVTPVSQGSATISVAQTSNTTGGTFNLQPATFTVNVSPPPNTAPTVTVAGVTGGASYNKGSVPNATCNVTDAEDGNSSFPATLSAVTGPHASDGIGSQTASCSYTDNGPGTGLTATASETYSIVDPSAPVITKTVTGQQGNNGWYTGNVNVDWTVSDSQSPNSVQKTNCDDFSVTSDQNSTTYTCSATSAGGTSSDSVTIKRDATAPQVTLGGVSGTAGDNGWYTSAVTQTFNASDATSDLVGPSSFTKSSGANEEGSNVSIGSGLVYDNAGNSASNSASFKIDLSDPVANCDSAPSAWSASDVSIRCQPTDAVSGLVNTADADFNLSTSVANGTETANASTDSRVVADASGRTTTVGPVSGIKVDKKAPVITSDGPTAAANGTNGWYTSAVTNGFTATDGGSGFAPSGDLTTSFNKSSGTNEGSAVQIASGPVSDAVGNEGPSVSSAAFKIDLSDPTNVAFVGGPAAGSSHYFGSVPAAPTCTADDAISGLKDCVVTGYSTAVGTHTLTAKATDNAGRTTTATRTYTVKSWTTAGFYQPVDMNGVYNTVKGGSTVPLKFELFAGSELTDTSAITSLQSQKITCSGTSLEDAIEAVATGGTSLRYDTMGGQFIYNWKTPTGAGSCYKVTVTAQDGSTISALFKLK